MLSCAACGHCNPRQLYAIEKNKPGIIRNRLSPFVEFVKCVAALFQNVRRPMK
jgi:hypothetical protein